MSTEPIAPTAPKPDADAAKRLRERVEQLLARHIEPTNASVLLDDGRRFDYTVRAGFLPVGQTGMGADRGEPQAAIFHVAYTAAHPKGLRPVCFVFNSGPGSSSVWLHLGALGPKRVPIVDDGSAPPSPYRLVDNPLTWLPHFDLVFIDPPHTGYSISASDEARKKLERLRIEMDGARVWAQLNYLLPSHDGAQAKPEAAR